MRGLKALVCVGALAVLLAACGSSGEHVKIEATPAAMRRAAETTLNKGASKLDMTMQMNVKGKDVSLHGTGVVDAPNRRVQMDFDAKQLFATLLAGKTVPPNVQAAFDQPLTELVDGTVLYMHFPLFAKGGSNKEWIKLDLAKANSSLGDLLGNGGSGPLGSDPSSFLHFLQGAGKVSMVGPEDVRGVHTTHFSGSYTLQDAASSLPAEQQQKVKDAFAGLGLPESASNTPIPFDAWLSDDGLVRRIATTIDPSQFTTNHTMPLGKMTLTIELYDFGTSVALDIPSDDQVQDVSNLIPKTGTSSSPASSVGN